MKNTDIMVGDWVKIEDQEEDPLYNKGWLTTQILDADELADVIYEGWKPIPLTFEILKKNGFEPIEIEGKLTIIDNDHLALVPDKDFSGPYNIFHTKIKIEYVHELQHIMELYKTDKEIEL